MGTSVRARRSVIETIQAFGLPTPPPLICRLTRHTHLDRDMRDGPTRRDPFDHDHAPARRHRSVTVHQSLLRVRVCLRQPHDPSEAQFIGGPTPTSPTWMDNTPRRAPRNSRTRSARSEHRTDQWAAITERRVVGRIIQWEKSVTSLTHEHLFSMVTV